MQAVGDAQESERLMVFDYNNTVASKISYLSNVHSSGWFKPIIANGLRLLSEKIQQLILLYTLFPNTSHNPKLLLYTHPKSNQVTQSLTQENNNHKHSDMKQKIDFLM